MRIKVCGFFEELSDSSLIRRPLSGQFDGDIVVEDVHGFCLAFGFTGFLLFSLARNTVSAAFSWLLVFLFVQNLYDTFLTAFI